MELLFYCKAQNKFADRSAQDRIHPQSINATEQRHKMDWDNSSNGSIVTDVAARDRKQVWVWIHFTAINVVTLVSVAGNVLVITVISQTRSLHTATSVFIVTLSVSDLCTTLTVMLPSGIALASQSYQSYQQQFCEFLGFCYIQFRIASIYALSSISVERCMAIQVPLKYATLVTRRRTTVTVVLIWIIPCIMATLPFLLNKDYTYSTLKGLCVPNYKDNLGYTLVVLCGGVCIPLLVTLVMYCCIARVALKQARKGVIVCDENHCQYVSSRKGEFKAVKTLCAITGIFFLCWLPYTITNVWSSSTEHNANVHWDITCEVLTFLSAALNPCLYSLLNRTFRQALVRTQKRLSLNISECCLSHSNGARNGQVSNISISNVNSHAAQMLQEKGNLNKNQNEITILSVTKLKCVKCS